MRTITSLGYYKRFLEYFFNRGCCSVKYQFSWGFVLSLALMVCIVLQKARFVCFLSAFVWELHFSFQICVTGIATDWTLIYAHWAHGILYVTRFFVVFVMYGLLGCFWLGAFFSFESDFKSMYLTKLDKCEYFWFRYPFLGLFVRKRFVSNILWFCNCSFRLPHYCFQ